MDLIPLETNGGKGCNLAWAKRNNYYSRYYQHLDRTATINDNPNKQDYCNWMACGHRIQIEIKELGICETDKEVLRLASEYNLRRTSDGQPPTSVDDVLAIFQDKTWYYDNLAKSRKTIYVLTYGLFRKGYNQWAITASNNWLKDHGLRYVDKDKADKAQQRKGFVYRILINKASDRLTKKVQNGMKTHLREFISVRRMDINKNLVSYEKLNLGEKIFYVGSFNNENEVAPIQALTSALERAKKLLTKEVVLELVNNVFYTSEGKC